VLRIIAAATFASCLVGCSGGSAHPVAKYQSAPPYPVPSGRVLAKAQGTGSGSVTFRLATQQKVAYSVECSGSGSVTVDLGGSYTLPACTKGDNAALSLTAPKGQTTVHLLAGPKTLWTILIETTKALPATQQA
jgi:hypothetical protein